MTNEVKKAGYVRANMEDFGSFEDLTHYGRRNRHRYDHHTHLGVDCCIPDEIADLS